MWSEPKGLDPHKTLSADTQEVNSLTQVALLKFWDRTDGFLSPEFAKSWTVSSDAKTFTFELIKGMKYPKASPMNGREVTADDVLFSLKRLQSDVNPQKAPFEPIIGMEKLDDYTIRLRTAEPNPLMLNFLGLEPSKIVPKEMVDEHGDLSTVEAQVGAGAFTLKTWEKGSKMLFDKNEEFYWADLVYLDGIDAIVMPDFATRLAAVRTGQADGWVQIKSPKVMDELRKTNPSIEFTEYFRGCTNHLWLQTKSEKFQDIRVREAIGLAINNDAINKVIAEGRGQNCAQIPTGFTDFALPADEIAELYPHDPAKAKQLLADAGVSDLTVSLAYTPQYHTQQAELYDAMFREAGIKLDLSSFSSDPSGWFEYLYGNRNFPDLGIAAASLQFPEQYMLFIFKSGGGRNLNGFGDSKIDGLVEEMITTVDVAKRGTLTREIQRIYAKEHRWMFTQPSTLQFTAWNPRVKNHGWGNTYRGIYDLGGMRWSWLDG